MKKNESGGMMMRVMTAPWIISFICEYTAACGRYNFIPDEQAMRVMAALAMRVEIPL